MQHHRETLINITRCDGVLFLSKTFHIKPNLQCSFFDRISYRHTLLEVNQKLCVKVSVTRQFFGFSEAIYDCKSRGFGAACVGLGYG